MILQLRTLAELSEFITSQKQKKRTIGFVPTMGFLHKGHMSLINLAKESCDIVIASIYVNPSQFNDSSDFDNYPKDEQKDLELLSNNFCDAVFIPTQLEIESIPNVRVDLGTLGDVMEGRSRPGHFEGVVEIVHRLFKAVSPHKAFFGNKDYQQLLVVKKMADSCSLSIEIIGASIVREPSGLAMSSRNVRLSKDIRNKAGFIYETLSKTNLFNIKESRAFLTDNEFELEYLEIHSFGDDKRLFVAGLLDCVRLIDIVKVN